MTPCLGEIVHVRFSKSRRQDEDFDMNYNMRYKPATITRFLSLTSGNLK